LSDVKALQLLNTPLMLVKAVPDKSTVAREVQLLNALLPMLVRAVQPDKSTVVKVLQPRNALTPMLVRLV
jgi:hypothetical protein